MSPDRRKDMIILTKLRGEEFVLNSDLIETITENPDTTILLTTGKRLIVRESQREVIDKVAEFKRRTMEGIWGRP